MVFLYKGVKVLEVMYRVSMQATNHILWYSLLGVDGSIDM
jgi:hypothetical protein